MLARRLFSALISRHRPICTSRAVWARHHSEEEDDEELGGGNEEEETDGRRNHRLWSTLHHRSEPGPSNGGDREAAAAAAAGGGGGESEEGEGEESESSSLAALPKVLRAYLRSRRSRCISRVREQGRVPAVLVNDASDRRGSAGNVLLSVDAQPIASILKLLGKRDFASHVFDMHIYRAPESEDIKESLQVLPRNLNYGEGKTNILNIQFIRANPNQILKLGVPLEYLGLDRCPGLEKGGTLKRLAKYVFYNCKATEVPAKIIVDTTALEIGDRVLVQDLEVDYDLLDSDRTMPVCEIIKDVETLTAKSKRLKSEILHKKNAFSRKDNVPKVHDSVQTLSSDDESDVDEDDNEPYMGKMRRSPSAKGKVNLHDYVDGNVTGEEPQLKHKKTKSTYRRKRALEGRKPGSETEPVKKVKLSKRRLIGSSVASRNPAKPKLKEKTD